MKRAIGRDVAPGSRTSLVLVVAALAAVVLLGYLAVNSSSCSRPPTYFTAQQHGGAAVRGTHASLAQVLSSVLTASSDSLEGALADTGFAHASVGALLDRTKGLIDSAQRRELVRLQQAAFCRAGLHKEWEAQNISRVAFGNASLFVYGDNDIVSNNLLGAGHSWEGEEINQMLWALRAPMHGLMKEGPGSSPPLMVDIGANIGWFTLNAAAAGARVAAFEGMPSNIQLIRTTMCHNPWIMERTALYGTGLGDQDAQCYVVSGAINKGDGHTMCVDDIDKQVAEKNAANPTHRYGVRGRMSIRRLDDILQEDVKVLKIDIEGFEMPALSGARDLLTKHKVWFLMTECSEEMLGRKRVLEYFKFLSELGYAISMTSFEGPFVSDTEIADGLIVLTGVNLFCVRNEWVDRATPALGQSTQALN